MAHSWAKRKPAPFANFTNMESVNPAEFIIAPAEDSATFEYNPDGIYRYNTIQDDWCKIFDYPKDFNSVDDFSTVYDDKNKCIYILQGQKLSKFDLNTNSMQYLATFDVDFYFGAYPRMFCVNQNIHIMTAYKKTNTHYILSVEPPDSKTKIKIVAIQAMLSNTNIEPDAATWIKHRNCVISPAIVVVESTATQRIVELNLGTNQWNTWNLYQTPKYPFASSVVKTINEDYIIFVGGMDIRGRQQWKDTITYYNLKEKTSHLSSIKCPRLKDYVAAITRNEFYDKLVSFGYIRINFNLATFEDNIVLLISDFLCTEALHVIHEKDHWVINVDLILQR